jgi:FkbM family methyltransferase
MTAGSLHALEDMLVEGRAAAVERERTTFDRLAGSRGEQLVFFGAGGLGRRMLGACRLAGVEPLAFADNQEKLWNAEVDGVRVLSPFEAADRYGSDATFVVTIWGALGHDRMHDRVRQLRDLGCASAVPFLPLAWKHPDRMLPHYGAHLPHRVYDAVDDVTACYWLWADDASRREYVDQIRWRLLGDFDGLPAPTKQPIYFPRDLCAPRSDETFVDCGAFDGDTVRLFLREAGSFRKIYAFEPDPVNFDRLQASFEELGGAGDDDVHALPYATGARRETLRFNATGSAMSALGAGDIEVQAVALDDVLCEEAPTFIKMDIEGGEPEALAGAIRIIREHEPVLAISCYHRQEHLWQIPLQIRAISPNYRLFLRPHDLEMWDLVCYAVPVSRLAAT